MTMQMALTLCVLVWPAVVLAWQAVPSPAPSPASSATPRFSPAPTTRISPSPVPSPSPGSPPAANRFHAMDRNQDGAISREEWRGNDSSFKKVDTNGDGVLSGDEVKRPSPAPSPVIVTSPVPSGARASTRPVLSPSPLPTS